MVYDRPDAAGECNIRLTEETDCLRYWLS